MIEPELKNELDQINQQLAAISKKSGTSLWRAFLSGIMSALGYLVGLAIVVGIIVWVLQKTGLWSSFQQELQSFYDIINSAKQFTSPGSTMPSQKNSGGQSIITLPNGQQYRVNVSQ